jgi:hypothetical protein
MFGTVSWLSGNSMPAPTLVQIQDALTQAYINQGFIKQTVDPVSGSLTPTVPPVLPDLKAKEVLAQAIAFSAIWTTWQAAEIVSIPVTATAGDPSTGILT